jgi:hypothetical protein
MADEAKGLFPELPEDLKSLTDDERGKLLADHEAAKDLILEDNAEFLGDLSANEIIAELEKGVGQIKQIKETNEELKAEFDAFQNRKAELAAELEPMVAEDPGDETDAPDEEEAPAEEEAVVAEAEEVAEEEPALVTASVDAPVVRYNRQPPKASAERTPIVAEPAKTGTALVASSQYAAQTPGELNPDSLAHLMRDVASDLGSVAHDGKLVTRQKVAPWQRDHYPDGTVKDIGGGYTAS